MNFDDATFAEGGVPSLPVQPLIDCFPIIDSWRSETLRNPEERDIAAAVPKVAGLFLFNLPSKAVKQWPSLRSGENCRRTGKKRKKRVKKDEKGRRHLFIGGCPFFFRNGWMNASDVLKHEILQKMSETENPSIDLHLSLTSEVERRRKDASGKFNPRKTVLVLNAFDKAAGLDVLSIMVTIIVSKLHQSSSCAHSLLAAVLLSMQQGAQDRSYSSRCG
ncbi:STYKc [Musa troglodytarum]|uniref:STYKc n=1 Tax=Musa troglodytarum TaxID=320322 RepID=A0A9E7K414_9LILI|nr:STYKc [Musa troglodytarum]